jgi:hypothetical protein
VLSVSSLAYWYCMPESLYDSSSLLACTGNLAIVANLTLLVASRKAPDSFCSTIQYEALYHATGKVRKTQGEEGKRFISLAVPMLATDSMECNTCIYRYTPHQGPRLAY